MSRCTGYTPATIGWLWNDAAGRRFLKKKAPKANERIAYGKEARQFGDLRVPQDELMMLQKTETQMDHKHSGQAR